MSEEQEQEQLKPSELLMGHIKRTLKRVSDPTYPNDATVGMIFAQTYAIEARGIIRERGGMISTEDAYHVILDYYFGNGLEHLHEDPVMRLKLHKKKYFGPNTRSLFDRWEREGFPTTKEQRRLEMEAAKSEDIKLRERGKKVTRKQKRKRSQKQK
jgi:hypothetical protein